MEEEKTYCTNCDKYTKEFNEEKEEWICTQCEEPMKCEYVFAYDCFDDDNEGFIYGVQEHNEDTLSVGYIEWFKTIKELEKNTEDSDLIILNREQFLNNVREIK